MEWKRAIEEERAALGRIVVLLCTLADLAEYASGRSAIVLGLVLWLLRHAESVARDFVEGCADACSASIPVVPEYAGPRDAVRLAISLRELARQLDKQARSLCMPWGQIGGDAAAWPSGRWPALRDALASLSRVAVAAPGAKPPAHAPGPSCVPVPRPTRC